MVPLLAVLCLFHAGVLVLLDISFWQNVIVYAAFVSWSALPDDLRAGGRWLSQDHRHQFWGSLAAAFGLVAAAYAGRFGMAAYGLDGLITMLGGVFGAIVVVAMAAQVWPRVLRGPAGV